MPSPRRRSPENQISFIPRPQRPRSPCFVRTASVIAFKPKSKRQTLPTPSQEEPKCWAVLLPAWIRQSASWVVVAFVENFATTSSGNEEEVCMMSGTSPVEGGVRFEYDESVWEAEAALESVEARVAELRLS